MRLIIFCFCGLLLAGSAAAAALPIEPSGSNATDFDFLTGLLAVVLGISTSLVGLFFFNGLLYGNLLFLWGAVVLVTLIFVGCIFIAWRFGSWRTRPKWWLLGLFFGSVLGLVAGFMLILVGLLGQIWAFAGLGLGLVLLAAILLFFSRKPLSKASQ